MTLAEESQVMRRTMKPRRETRRRTRRKCSPIWIRLCFNQHQSADWFFLMLIDDYWCWLMLSQRIVYFVLFLLFSFQFTSILSRACIPSLRVHRQSQNPQSPAHKVRHFHSISFTCFNRLNAVTLLLSPLNIRSNGLGWVGGDYGPWIKDPL